MSERMIAEMKDREKQAGSTSTQKATFDQEYWVTK